MALAVTALAFSFKFFLSPTVNITRCRQEVQSEDPWNVPIQIQQIRHLFKLNFLSLLFLFQPIKEMLSNPLFQFSSFCWNRFRPILNSNYWHKIPKSIQDLLSSVLVNLQDYFIYKIFNRDSLQLTIPNNQIWLLSVL